MHPRAAAKYQETENEVIGNQLHALNGAWLFASHKYAEAVAELEQVDSDGFAIGCWRAPSAKPVTRQRGRGVAKAFAIHASTIDAVLWWNPRGQKFSLAARTSSKLSPSQQLGIAF